VTIRLASLVGALAVAIPAVAVAQPPVHEPDARPAERRPLTIAAEPHPAREKLKIRSEPAERPLFHDWSLDGGSSWSAAHGFQIRGDGTIALVPGLSPSWLAMGPSWDFTVRAGATGPGGVRFTAKAGGTSNGRMPLFASPMLVAGGAAGPMNQQLDPAQRDQIWSVGAEVERVFDLGRIDLALFGEALYLGGKRPVETGAAPPPGVKSEKPVRLFGGVGLKF
jgi:hypothetical protein